MLLHMCPSVVCVDIMVVWEWCCVLFWVHCMVLLGGMDLIRDDLVTSEVRNNDENLGTNPIQHTIHINTTQYTPINTHTHTNIHIIQTHQPWEKYTSTSSHIIKYPLNDTLLARYTHIGVITLSTDQYSYYTHMYTLLTLGSLFRKHTYYFIYTVRHVSNCNMQS